MSESKQHSALPTWLRRSLWGLLALAILLLGLRFSLKTQTVRSFTKDQITSIANSSLNGTLQIRNISGDLWSDFTVSGITLTDLKADTLLSVADIHIRHSLLKLIGLTYQSCY